MGAAGQSDSTKNLYEGKEYDFVFSVDIAEGQPPLKLPYNSSEDPWTAAQKFIHKNDLSQYYLDTIANFIITNSKGASSSNGSAPAPNAGDTYTDPFTGASRYVPSSSNSVPTAQAANGGAGDPFTGSGRYIPADEVLPVKAGNAYFPVRDCLRFDQANVEAITSMSTIDKDLLKMI